MYTNTLTKLFVIAFTSIAFTICSSAFGNPDVISYCKIDSHYTFAGAATTKAIYSRHHKSYNTKNVFCIYYDSNHLQHIKTISGDIYIPVKLLTPVTDWQFSKFNSTLNCGTSGIIDPLRCPFIKY